MAFRLKLSDMKDPGALNRWSDSLQTEVSGLKSDINQLKNNPTINVPNTASPVATLDISMDSSYLYITINYSSGKSQTAKLARL